MRSSVVIVVIQTLTEKLNRKSFAVGRSLFLLRELVVAVNMHVRFDSRVALTRAIRKATERLKFRSNYRIRLGPSWDMPPVFRAFLLSSKAYLASESRIVFLHVRLQIRGCGCSRVVGGGHVGGCDVELLAQLKNSVPCYRC